MNTALHPMPLSNVRLKVLTYNVEGRALARCPYLNVVTSAATEELAVQYIAEEIAALVDFCSERGNLAAVIQHRLSIAKLDWPGDDLRSSLDSLQEHWIEVAMPVQGAELLTHASIRLPESAGLH